MRTRARVEAGGGEAGSEGAEVVMGVRSRAFGVQTGRTWLSVCDSPMGGAVGVLYLQLGGELVAKR